MSNKILAKDVEQGQFFTYELDNISYKCYRIQTNSSDGSVGSIDIEQSIYVHFTNSNQEVYV